MNPPPKPFPEYKWRWAVLTPTESLNDPPIYLGILRVLAKNEGHRFSSAEVFNDLIVVEGDLRDRLPDNLSLARDTSRNIFRNSQQYWKALGLLDDRAGRGEIALTPFGRNVAAGGVPHVEFALTIIRSLQLPNRHIEDASEWRRANLTIKPLELILNILAKLITSHGESQGFLTPNELIKIVIPLAGTGAILDIHKDALIQYREGTLDPNNWPNCAPGANDKRMAKEFLLFLSNYGFCRIVGNGGRYEEKYFLGSISTSEIQELNSISIQNLNNISEVEEMIRRSQIPANIDRKRVIREVLDRPHQAAFRKNILDAFDSKCILSGVSMPEALEAAHIKPVKYQGPDTVGNGFCLRADLHRLYDANHIKILPDGSITYTDIALLPENYFGFPSTLTLPSWVNSDYLDWRFKYM